MIEDEYYDLEDFKKEMIEATKKLKKLSEMQNRMHWQFGNPDYYDEFVSSVDEAVHGWMASNC